MSPRLVLLALLAILLPSLTAHAFTVERVISPGGIEAWLIEDHSNPVLSMAYDFRGGAALDPPGKSGLASMTADMLDEGAGDLDSQAFQGKLDDLAIKMGFRVGQDSLHGDLRTVTANRDMAFSMLGLALTKPRFDADSIERVRGQTLAILEREQQQPPAVAERALMALLFPSHPYGRREGGDQDSIKSFTRDDMVAWVGRRLGRDVLTIAVVGDITPAQLAPLLDSTFGALPAKAEPGNLPDVAPAATGKVEVIRRPIPQSVAAFGEQGIKRDDPDWYAAFVVNYIIGSGNFSSRLMIEVREKRGLTYSIYAYMVPEDHTGILGGEFATRNERFAESLAIVKAEWKKLAEHGVTAKELADAKTYITGSFPLSLGSTNAIAGLLNSVQVNHLGIDFLDRRNKLINSVTLADANRVAKRLFNADALTTVVVGDPKGM